MISDMTWGDRGHKDEQLLFQKYQSKMYCRNDISFISGVQLK